MKNKLFLLCVCIIHCCWLCSQNQYNANQIRFRDDIKRFLQEEGYTPTINSNTGDINFKMEGTNYVIGLSTDYNGPYFVSLSAVFNMDPMSYSEKLRLYEIENTINGTAECVKVNYFEYDQNNRLLEFAVESFCHNSDDFKYALVKYLGFIKVAINDFREQFSSNSPNSASNNNHIVVHYSNTLRTSDHSWEVVSVDFTSSGTVITKKVTPKNANTYVYSVKDEFIEDADTGNKYYIKDSSIGFTKYKTFLNNTASRTFTETYPILPSNVSRINISSGSYYYVKNLKIR